MACQVFVASRESELVHYWGRVGEGVHYWGGVGEGEFCQRWRIVRSNKQGEISNETYNTVGIAKTKQKNKVFGCGEHTMEVVLKVVALVELVVLVKPLSVGRVVPSCAGTKAVNDNRKMSSECSSKSQHNTTQHNREKTRTIHTANRNTTQRNTTGKRQEHNTQQIATQRNATQLEEHNMTKDRNAKDRRAGRSTKNSTEKFGQKTLHICDYILPKGWIYTVVQVLH